MVQSRKGLRLRQSHRGSRCSRYLRPHGDGPELGHRRSSAGSASSRPDCRGQEGPDRGRTAFGILGRAVAAVAIASAAACGSATTAPKAALEKSPSGLEQVPLTIRSAKGTSQFTVEVAQTPQQQEQGLMFRQSLAPDRGMIFPRDPPGDATFWMKNTLIPLDMIFIRTDGSIARIAPNAVPMSLDPVPSLEPVGAVLEIAGGRAAELGLKPGDKVSWKQ
ncbi:MAG: DUF192 domain-containing protein [Sphingomonas sp.]|nr:DUF192 domain-containing protein [Sphingomonas sp.]